MFCKWCGMESAATDLCSWCHRPLSATTTTTETEAAPEATETPTQTAPVARPLVVEEPAEEEEESPLAAGITAGPAARRPAPAHRPAWTPVPRAGTTPGPTPVAPTTPAPETPQTGTPPSSGARPVIGVRRAGGTPAADTGAAAAGAGGGAIGVRRPVGAAPATGGTNRAPVPAPNRPAPNTNNRPAAPGPVPAGGRPASSPAAPASRDPFVPPVAATADSGAEASASVRTAVPVNRAGVAPTRQTSAPPVEEGEAGGLADGIAAGKRPVERQAGVPALGTFTAANSKYYTGQVVDPASGTHYDSSTGQATSAPPQQRPEDVILQWDDPTSTPRHLGRFAMAFAGLLIGMAGLVHILPDYAALPLVIVMFAAGVLLPVMRAVPFQSDDSDDLVWLILLTLLFGPSIGLLIYSVKAFLLHDMNSAVLGLLTVGFLGYLVFQIAAPLAPVTPDAGESFFNMMKLAPPWTQVTRYGYAALLYNWVGLVAMVGWFVGNVFHKLDE